MKILLLIIAYSLALFLSYQAYAQERINVYVRDGNRNPVHHTGPEPIPDKEPDPCFPYGCKGIEGPFRNPDSEARNPENLTSCIYGPNDALLYERPGKFCPMKYVDQNELRMENKR